MPAAEEKLAEKIPFNVYGILLVLSALATLGAILMLNADLRQYWYAAEEPPGPKMGYVSTVNVPATAKGEPRESDWVVVNELDRKDYEVKWGKPLEAPPFPEWLDPLKKAIKTDYGADNSAQVPDAEKEKLKQDFVEKKDPTEFPEAKGQP